MLKVLSIISLLISIAGFSQVRRAVVSMPAIGRAYFGYSNLIEVSFKSKKVKKYTIECQGCAKLKKIESIENFWSIQPDSVKQILLKVRNKRGKIVGEKKYQVFYPPIPTMFLDSVAGNNAITFLPRTLSLQLSPDLPISSVFVIKNWIIEINDETFKGSFNEISQDVKNYLSTSRKGIMVVNVFYYGPVKGAQKCKEIFEYNLE